ncbi:(d)CMP kinase [Rhodocytophaga aerolata]|uniref:Cytidylate kinase n=1 Tax=Rhodocytophaga aerolata TaxID=455078 RepID=A0ABT8RG04_9BACT|nr:(d)CMP kinase [Rhodocytophaga aerolata]MDO1450073.1 (d)CMP kinase [Rhodocytophaga aerolata]
MKKIIIAIDGYSACGKSTTAKMVASRLGYIYIDSGAMYRAVTLYFCDNHISSTNPYQVSQALANIHIQFVHNPKTEKNETYLNGLNVEEEIRKMYISQKVSEVSAVPEVRKAMVYLQQQMGKKRGLVMDGRDIGTCVFPDAELKIFMTADIMVRAQRRQEELLEKNELVDIEEIIKNLQMRDHLDTTRKQNPLRMADDAYLLDNTAITIDEQIEFVINLANSRMIQSYNGTHK